MYMALKMFKKEVSKNTQSSSELNGNSIFLKALLKKFERDLKQTGKEFKTIDKIDLSLQINPDAKILEITFYTDNGIFKLEV